MEGIYLFPTTIFRTSNFLTRNQCDDIVDYLRSSNSLKKHGAMSGLATSTHSSDSDAISLIENLPECENFRTKIENALNHAAQEYGLFKQVAGNSWVNFQHKDSILHNHRHPMSILSVAFYLRADENSSSIKFYNPNVFNKFWSEFNHDTFSNFDNYEYKVKTGDLYIFPSWLEHGGGDKNMSEERVVFSCNSESAEE